MELQVGEKRKGGSRGRALRGDVRSGEVGHGSPETHRPRTKGYSPSRETPVTPPWNGRDPENRHRWIFHGERGAYGRPQEATDGGGGLRRGRPAPWREGRTDERHERRAVPGLRCRAGR